MGCELAPGNGASSVMRSQPHHVVREDGIRGKIEKRQLGLEISKLQHEKDLSRVASAQLRRRPFRWCEREILRALELVEVRPAVEGIPLLGR